MKTPSSKLLIVLCWIAPLAGCGGIESAPSCPNGNCETACTAGTYASGGTCVSFTVCPAGTYVAQAGSASTDQVCLECPSGTLSISTDSATCTPWQSCTAGTYVSNAPSATIDRVCSSCPTGTYTTTANQSTCLTATDCPAGTVQTASGGTVSTPVCTPCASGQYCVGGTAAAVACPDEKWDDDANPATACVAKTVCGPGTFVVAAGSATVDRTCSPCSSGSFMTSKNSNKCYPWTNCAPGTYVSTPPSTISDRVCAKCPSGTDSTAENQSVCLAGNDCAAGTVQTAPGTASSGPVCAPCSKGEYCQGGSSPARTCANGTWDDDSDPATPCVTWSSCAAGTYVSASGSATNDQVCSACPTGSFSTSVNSQACSEWKDCIVGTYVVKSPSATTDRQCADCATGTYSTSVNQSACQATGECPAGTVQVVAGTSTTPPACTLCSAGEYCAGGTSPVVSCGDGNWDNDGSPATPCVDWTLCTSVLTPGTATSDQVCFGACPAGTVQTAAGTPTTPPVCTPCSAGEYCAGGTSPVVSCGDGNWDKDGNPATPCVDWTACTTVLTPGSAIADQVCLGACPAGTVQTAAGTSPPVCTPCSAGEYCAGGTSPVVPCGFGNWDNDGNPATPCVAWTSCTFVRTLGTATSDVVCFDWTKHTLTPCGATGHLGPTQPQCNTAYAGMPQATEIAIQGNGIQRWTVPVTGTYRIEAFGAQGASGDVDNEIVGGRGAYMRGDFALTAGDLLDIAVGQMGLGQGSGHSGGGGGGSFVVPSTGAPPLLVAGGGGGRRFGALNGLVNGFDASIEVNGVDGIADFGNAVVPGGTAGAGGSMLSSWGCGGGGFSGDGADDSFGGTGGKSFTHGAEGGLGDPNGPPADGGFGGGGSGNGASGTGYGGGGGGGGYSGGGGGFFAGGGGSYNGGASQSNVAGVQTGDGTVTIDYLGPS